MMNRYLWVSAGLFAAALASGLIAFVFVYLPLVHSMRMVFFTSATLAFVMLMVGLVQE